MSYFKKDFKIQRVSGRATLNVGFRLGNTQLGNEVGYYEDVPVSKTVINDGYSIGDNGELSLDPSTMTATLSEYVNEVGTYVFLSVGDYVECSYEETLLYTGIVRQIDVDLETSHDAMRRGENTLKQTTYAFSSLEAMLLNKVAFWDSLDEETALERISRWFELDTSEMASSHLAQLDVIMPKVEPGEDTLLNLARAFSAATNIPLRLAVFRGPFQLEAFDTSTNWTDQPMVPMLADTADWATGTGFTTTSSSLPPIPSGLTVKTDDTRLLGGTTEVGIDQPLLSDDFRLNSSRLGTITSMEVGFRAPMPIDVFGTTLAVLRVTHTFGEHYNASLELSPAAQGEMAPNLAVSYAPRQRQHLVPPTSGGTSPDWGYNVRDFGAKGNGTTDDTLAIQNCLDQAEKVKAHVMVPAGTYRISSPLRVGPNTNVWGEGKYSSTIVQSSTDTDGIHFVYPNLGEGIAIRGGLHYLRIQGPSGSVGTGTGVYGAILNSDGSIATGKPLFGGVFDNIMIQYFGGHGLWLRGIFGTTIEHVDCWEGGHSGSGFYAFFLDGGDLTQGTYQTSTVISHCYANYYGDWGYYATKQQYTTYLSCSVDSSVEGGYFLRDCTAISYVSCGAESTEASDLDATYAPDPVPGNDPITGLPLLGHANAAVSQPMKYGWKIVSSLYGGSTGISFLSCWNYGVTDIGWWFCPDDQTSEQTFTVQAQMTNCTNMTINKVAADYIAAVKVDTNSEVAFFNNRIRPAPESDPTKGYVTSADSNTMFYGVNTLGNLPGGISWNLNTPLLYPYKDSVQALSRGATQSALVARGAAGQSWSTFSVQTSDGFPVFDVNEAYTTFKPTSAGALNVDFQDHDYSSVVHISQADGLVISAKGKGVTLPVYASPTALNASGLGYGAIAMCEATGVGAGAGTHLCVNLGSWFYIDNAGPI